MYETRPTNTCVLACTRGHDTSIRHLQTYVQDLLHSIFQHQMYGTRYHDYQLIWRKLKDSNRVPQSKSFFYRIMQIWNDLSADVNLYPRLALSHRKPLLNKGALQHLIGAQAPISPHIFISRHLSHLRCCQSQTITDRMIITHGYILSVNPCIHLRTQNT